MMIEMVPPNGNGNGVQLLAGRSRPDRSDHVALELQNGAEVFDISTGENPVQVTSAGGMADNQWHFATGIRSGNLESRLQVDGTTTESSFTDQGIAPGRAITTAGTLLIWGPALRKLILILILAYFTACICLESTAPFSISINVRLFVVLMNKLFYVLLA